MHEADHQRVSDALQQRMRECAAGLVIPPPAFLAMRGEFLKYDERAGTLAARFPVLPEQLNPFGTMQGGVIAAAVDNTVGPLSLLVAPPSVTRRLEIKYSRGVSAEDAYIHVEARLVERKKRRLFLEATVTDPQGVEVASGTAVHWVIDSLPDRRAGGGS